MTLFSKSQYLALAGAVFFSITGCVLHASSEQDKQGWSDSERLSWYQATQGSRLMPLAWFDALEQPETEAKFAAIDNLTRFGFLAYPNSAHDKPIGFVKDRQADGKFAISGLSWYEGQSHTAQGAETWIGLNCSACHTAQLSYQGRTSTIDGGPNLLDFQLFVEALDDALVANRSDPAKWNRFSSAVLKGRDTPANRAKLEDAFDRFVAWQLRTHKMNETPVRYGFGRLDAVGHILNKILMFNQAGTDHGNPANAPVSYPFIWDIWRQDRVQWNGVARNSRFQTPGDDFEYGALGRNAGEVLGVFGEVNVTERQGVLDDFKGFTSTIQTENLVKLELILQKLKSPAWPAHFPAIDQGKAIRGRELFAEQCASCHLTPDLQKAGQGTEVMVTFEETLRHNPENLTDIWMACNAFVYTGPSGPMKGMTDPDGKIIGAEANVANMLAVAVKGSLIGDKPGLVKSAVQNFFGIRRPPVIVEEAPVDQREADRDECLTTRNQPLLAYKARPLDGIWATAPYLHNGSVASLYELLLPASERQTSFWVGNREYDPVKVGYVTSEPATGGFLLKTRNDNGKVIEGNSNKGHEYGVGALSEEDRLSLLEYMKTL